MNRKFLVFAVLAFALILSACGPTTINQEAPAPARTLNVNGLGQVNLTPDIAYIYIGVHTEGATASEAVEANKGQTSSLISSIKKSGVDEKTFAPPISASGLRSNTAPMARSVVPSTWWITPSISPCANSMDLATCSTQPSARAQTPSTASSSMWPTKPRL
ncbi:MAG: SIMPL domain-containing protein [Anaerolineales bacterium]|nr:SIMPL domain-containing protein [Anaerolineales bacterium]